MIMDLASPLVDLGVEIYKSVVKSIILSDQNFIFPILRALNVEEQYLDSTYAMMHMPFDLKEKGGWHRDANSDIEVIWVPITSNKYFRISYVPFTEMPLLSKLFLVVYRLIPWLPSKSFGKDRTIWRWNGRLIHRGNLNTSDQIALQYQIIIRPSRSGPSPLLSDYTVGEIKDLIRLIGETLADSRMQIDKNRYHKFQLFFQSFQHITKLRGCPVVVDIA